MQSAYLLLVGEGKCPGCEASSRLLRDEVDMETAIGSFALHGPELCVCLETHTYV